MSVKRTDTLLVAYRLIQVVKGTIKLVVTYIYGRKKYLFPSYQCSFGSRHHVVNYQLPRHIITVVSLLNYRRFVFGTCFTVRELSEEKGKKRGLGFLKSHYFLSFSLFSVRFSYMFSLYYVRSDV